MDLKGKKVTVIGLGNSGRAAATLLADRGAAVWVTDAHDTPEIRAHAAALAGRGISVETGGHTKAFIEGSVLVVASPGVEDTSPAVRWADEARIPIISELELGYRFCKGTIIAITGTNGKSTVTTLVGEILKDGGKDTVVCGNIGNALSGEIPRITKDTYVVVEVSSFQLERTTSFKPHIAVILNITDDHLDRYAAFADYFAEKLKVFSRQDAADILILNADARNLQALAGRAASKVLWYSRLRKVEGAYVRGGMIVTNLEGRETELLPADAMALKGLHNLENVAVCGLIGLLCGVARDSIRATVARFTGLRHRFETVAVIDGVEYIDDSKGTTVDSTRRALESCTKPVVLIAGGKDKRSDYGAIRDLVAAKVRHLVLIGEARERIGSALAGAAETHTAATMADAVARARDLASGGAIVLLSPMCSSFDMFKDYKHRGDVFRDAVMALRQASGKEGGRS